jgi:phosphoglycolate phosphatase
MTKLLICDWDGTIANSVLCIVRCKQDLARKYGLPIPTEATTRGVLGKDFKLAMEICFPTVAPEFLTKLCQEFRTLMLKKEYQANLFPEALNTLQQLQRTGYKLAVATSKSRVELNQAINALDMKDLFHMTCCAEEYKPKPSPKILEEICDNLKIPKARSVMLGDAESDVLCAQNAKIKIACVTFGAQTEKQLATYNPDGFIDHWRDLPALLIRLLQLPVKI